MGILMYISDAIDLVHLGPFASIWQLQSDRELIVESRADTNWEQIRTALPFQ
jgi:hypothetical protein